MPGRLVFGPCSIDLRRRELRVGTSLVALQPKVYELLCLLVQRPGQVFSKAELLKAIWRTAHVTDAVLATAMVKLRRAIGDYDDQRPMIATLRGVGYRFDGPVQVQFETDQPEPSVHTSPAVSADPMPPMPLVGRLAVLPFANASGDPVLDWVGFGLASLLHAKLSRSQQLRLMPLDSSMAWQPPANGAVDLAPACTSLGAGCALHGSVRAAGNGYALVARWGGADGTATRWQAEGAQVSALVEQLAAALLQSPPTTAASATGHVPSGWAPEAGLSFWEGQLARAMDLERRGVADQALTLLQACLPELPPAPEITLLHARLLRQRMELLQAEGVLQQGLQSWQTEADVQTVLLTEWAAVRQSQGDMAGALQHCEQAISLVAAGQASLDQLPVVLNRAAALDFACGAYRQSAQKSLRAKAMALSLDDNASVVVSTIHYARAAYMEGSVQAAHAALQEAVVLAHDSGLTGLEAEAYMRLAFQENVHWHHRAAVDYARRAAALASDRGDIHTWHSAHVREMLCLLDLGQVEAAQLLFDRHLLGAEGRHSAVSRDNQLTVQWTLDWRAGRSDAAIDCLMQTLGKVPDLAVDRRRRISYRLMMNLLCLNRRAEADQVLAQHQAVGYLTRQAHLHAAFALQRGDREGAKRQLRAASLTSVPDEVEAWHAVEALAWMQLEDGEAGGLAALMHAVQALSTEQASVPLVLQLHQVRSGACTWSQAHWCGLVRANPGLVHRHAWLLDEQECLAWLRGQRPKLAALLPDACF